MAKGTTTLRDALTDYRTQKSASLKLDGNYFYRRSVPTASANLYGTFPDLYDNSDDIHIVRGGQKNRASQFDATVSTRPTFGAGDLSGLYFRAKLNAIDRTDGPLTTAGLKAFLLSSIIRSEGGTTDGTSLIANEFVTAFSANLPSEPNDYYAELFDGVGEDVETEVEQGTLLVKRTPYITLSDAYKYGRFTGKKASWGAIYTLSKTKFRGRWCTKHATLGWICKVRQIRNRGRDRWETVKEKKLLLRRNRERFYDLRKNGKLKFMEAKDYPQQSNPYQRTLANQINANNSSMMFVKQAKTFSELSSTGGVKEIAWGKIAYSSENSYEGGQSVKMHTFWPAKTQKGSNDEYAFRKTNIFYPGDVTNKHTQQRQECYMVKRLPVPKLFQNQADPSGATTVGHNIQLRMNIKQLAPAESKAYNRTTTTASVDAGGWGNSVNKWSAFIDTNDNTYGPSSGGGSVTQVKMERVFTRGLAVCFSEMPPGYSDGDTADKPDDTFYTFMKRHHPSMETQYSADYAEDTSAKDFYGIFISQERGKYFAQSLGKHSSTGHMLWQCDPHTHKIGRADILNSAYVTEDTNDIDIGDRWVDYNFIVDTTSGVMECIISSTETENEAGAEMRIPIYNSSGATTAVQGTFPKYMSIWLVNYPNPNSGMTSSKATAFGGLGFGALNNFADTGLVVASKVRIADPGDATTEPQTVYIGGGTMDDFTVQARNTGDSSGTNELYWNVLAGTEVYLAGSELWGDITYGRLNSSVQSTSEARYGSIRFASHSARTINPGSAILINSAVPIDGNASNNEDMESIVYIDAIKLHNFNLSMNNATVSQYNTTPGSLKIPTPATTYAPSYADIEAWNGAEGTGPKTREKWSYWSLGFDSADDIEGAKKWFLLNNMKTSNAKMNNTPIYCVNIGHGHHTSSYIRVGYSDNTTALGGHTGLSHFGNNSANPSTAQMGLVVGGQGTGTVTEQFFVHSESTGTGTESDFINGFSRKGHFAVNFNEVSGRAIAKRESPYAAARVTKIHSALEGTFEVDNMEIFKLDPDTEYVMYREGAAVDFSSSATWRSGLKVLSTDEGEIRVNKNLDKADDDSTKLLCNTHIGNVWISPQKYWLNIAFLNKSESGDEGKLPERSWDSIIGVTGTGSSKGATYNEYMFSDMSPWVNIFARNLEPFDELDDNDVINNVDYGFGKYDDETETGGYAGKVVFDYTTNSSMATPHQTLDISGIVDALKPELGDTLPILLTTLSPEDTNVISVHAEESSNEYDKPYLLTEFYDELPTISDFAVLPYEDNPFLPHYTWSCDADDAWYGFLHIDSASIEHQYHNAVIHVPLNEEETTHPSHAKSVSTLLPTEEIQGLTNTVSGALRDIEGLAGYCWRFDGNDDYIEINNSPSIDPTADCTKEMTVVVHIIPDSASDQRVVVSQYSRDDREKFRILLNSSNQVEARVNFDGGSNYVELRSTSIIPTDGETPTCIILTADTEISSGNCKLFLNGKLEDISGQTTSSGSTNNWKQGNTINGGSAEIYIGNSASSGTNGFDGKIEELVIYKKCIYPFSGKDTDKVVTKPFVEIDSTSSTNSLSQMGKIFIKDYHNIRGKTVTQVATAPAVAFRKAAFNLDNS